MLTREVQIFKKTELQHETIKFVAFIVLTMDMLQNQIIKESPICHNKNHVTCKTTGVFPWSKKRLETREMEIDKAVSTESYLYLQLQRPNLHNVLLQLVVVQIQMNSYYQDYFFFFGFVTSLLKNTFIQSCPFNH